MRTTFGLVVLLTVLVWPLPSDGQLSENPAKIQRRIVLRLQDEASRVTTLTIPDGGTGTYTRPGLPMLRLTPTVQAPANEILSLSVSLESDESVPTVVRTETLSPGGLDHIEAGGYVLDVTWAAMLLVGEQRQSLSRNPPIECCVVCEGIKTCACKVQASCGSCAAPNCDSSCAATSPESRELGSRPAPNCVSGTVLSQFRRR